MNRQLAEQLDRLLLYIEEGQKYAKDSPYLCGPCEDTGWVVTDNPTGQRTARRCENPIHQSRREVPRTEPVRFQ